MRIVKPGRLGINPVSEQRHQKDQPPSNQKNWDVWNDFSSAKSRKPKKSYEKDRDGRFVRQKPVPVAVDTTVSSENISDEQEEVAQPRTDYSYLEKQLGYDFKDESLLEQALTHRSVLGFRERLNYERLEFLGDAVLDLAVADLLCDYHPEAREGDLSKMRAALVNTQALAVIATKLEIGAFIRLGKGELASGGAGRPSILADVMEAIIGAVYRDSSYEVALDVLKQVFGDAFEVVTPNDPKTELQEALHAAGSEPPSYLVEHVEGPEHAPTFVVVVMVDGEVAGRGRGATKKAAQQEAAAETLAKLMPEVPEIELESEQDIIIDNALIGARAKYPEVHE